jgi:hypothetical protein
MIPSEAYWLQILDKIAKSANESNVAARKKWGLTLTLDQQAQSVENSRLGGRPRTTNSETVLSPHAQQVKYYLDKNLTHDEIAKLLNCSRQAVGDVMRRYGLKRKQLSKFRNRDG